jgi:chemotaxis protein CheX
MPSLTLDAVLDLKAAAPLQAALLAWRGQPIELDAGQVQRLGGQCLQVLIAAQRSWADDGAPFSVARSSTAFDDALRLFGANARFDPARIDELDGK